MYAPATNLVFDGSQRECLPEGYAFVFDVVIIRRRPNKWVWQVRDRAGTILMHGWESTRDAAKYRGDRALFLLLAATSRSPPKMP
jgi:hypothetical protein